MKINISHKSGSAALHAEMRTFLFLLRTIQCLKSFSHVEMQMCAVRLFISCYLKRTNNISAADLSRTGSVPLKISIPPHLGEQKEPLKSDRKRRNWSFALSSSVVRPSVGLTLSRGDSSLAPRDQRRFLSHPDFLSSARFSLLKPPGATDSHDPFLPNESAITLCSWHARLYQDPPASAAPLLPLK